MTKTYDGATTALHRRIEAYQQNLSVAEQAAASAITKLGRAREWAKRWKALAKRMRVRHRNAMELAVTDRDGASDGAMVLTLQLKDLRVELENTKFRLSMATADPESQASQLLSKHNALMMASGNLAVQNMRIEELTAELARLRDIVSDGKRLRDRQKQISALQAALARVGTRLHFKRAEAAHWQEKAEWEDIAKAQTLRDGREIVSLRIRLGAAQERIIQISDDYDACHRQHEQCMKLLEMAEVQLREHPRILALVREMLSKGELPEGWDK